MSTIYLYPPDASSGYYGLALRYAAARREIFALSGKPH